MDFPNYLKLSKNELVKFGGACAFTVAVAVSSSGCSKQVNWTISDIHKIIYGNKNSKNKYDISKKTIEEKSVINDEKYQNNNNTENEGIQKYQETGVGKIIGGKEINENNLLINKNLKILGIKDFDFFKDYFDLDSSKFVSFIEDLQEKNGLKVDGIIGKNTLTKIYTEYYFGNKGNNKKTINSWIERRYNIYIDVIEKYKKSKALNGVGPMEGYFKFVNPFDHKIFFGETGESVHNGEAINEDLKDLKDIAFNKGGNNYVLKKIKGKYVSLFYIDTKLVFTSYSSPGLKVFYEEIVDKKSGKKIKKESDKKRTTTGTWTIKNIVLDKFHISSSYPVDKKTGKKGGFPMFSAFNLIGPERTHSGSTNGLGKSSGCPRNPMVKADQLFQIVTGIKNKNESITIIIDENLYN